MDFTLTQDQATSTDAPKVPRLSTKKTRKIVSARKPLVSAKTVHSKASLLPDSKSGTHIPAAKAKTCNNMKAQQPNADAISCLSWQTKTDVKVPPKKLEKQLRSMTTQNQGLQGAINERDREILELKKSMQTLNEVLNSVPLEELRNNSSIASEKILELNRRNQQLKMQLDASKYVCQSKDARINRLEQELVRLTKEEKQNPNKAVEAIDAAAQNARKEKTLLSDLESKLATTQQKLFESRNKVSELQQQLKRTQNCLQQEVGEGFDINMLHTDGILPNWRGRQQQILQLQQRVQTLKSRLDAYENQQDFVGADMACFTTETKPSKASMLSSRSAQAPHATKSCSLSSSKSIDRFAPTARRQALLHRNEVEKLQQEISELKQQLEDQRSKTLALNVRHKAMSNELQKYKMKASELEEQTGYNGLTMASIQQEMQQQKRDFQKELQEYHDQVTEWQLRFEEAKQGEKLRQNELQQMSKTLFIRDKYIKELELQKHRLESDMKAICGEFLFSCRDFSKEEFIAILDSLAVEKEALLGQNKILHVRVESERKKNDSLAEQLGKQKVRVCRLETKIRDLEKELEATRQRKKRSQRMAEYASSISSASLKSVVYENSTHSEMAAKEDALRAERDELKNHLEVAQEKITLLEEKLSNLLEEKDSDVRRYESILVNTRNEILKSIHDRRSMDLQKDDAQMRQK